MVDVYYYAKEVIEIHLSNSRGNKEGGMLGIFLKESSWVIEMNGSGAHFQ